MLNIIIIWKIIIVISTIIISSLNYQTVQVAHRRVDTSDTVTEESVCFLVTYTVGLRSSRSKVMTDRGPAMPLPFRAVIKSQGPGISPGYYECGPGLLLLENRRKLEPKETPRCLIPRLLVVSTRQLEILGKTLPVACFLRNKEPFSEIKRLLWERMNCFDEQPQ